MCVIKKILFSLILSLLIVPVYAQKVQDTPWSQLSQVAETRKINFEIDYSKADILGEDYADFVAGDAAWATDEGEIRSRFIRSFNTEADDGRYPHRLGSYGESDVKMLIKILEVRESGSSVSGLLFLYKENKLVFIRKVYAEKGRVGSVGNLMGDAMEVIGESLGSKFFRHSRGK